MSKQKAYLILEDGTKFEGYNFGAEGTCYGEVVFQTSMVGYQETLTDKSNHGLIITQTFPLIGNYGINDDDSESESCHLSGYIVREWCEKPSNFKSVENIDSFMKRNNVVGLYGIDTRALTRLIREKGVQKGMITTDSNADFQYISPKPLELINKTIEYGNNGQKKVALIDLGYNFSTVKVLNARGLDVTVVPPTITAIELKALMVDGIVLSSGAITGEVADISEIVKLPMPILGIGCGHIILAKAYNLPIAKMKYGHRGGNQPVANIKNGKTYVTVQNHGYVVTDALNYTVTHRNSNDKTIEGIQYANNVCSVEFIPDSVNIEQSTVYVYKDFIAAM